MELGGTTLIPLRSATRLCAGLCTGRHRIRGSEGVPCFGHSPPTSTGTKNKEKSCIWVSSNKVPPPSRLEGGLYLSFLFRACLSQSQVDSGGCFVVFRSFLATLPLNSTGGFRLLYPNRCLWHTKVPQRAPPLVPPAPTARSPAWGLHLRATGHARAAGRELSGVDEEVFRRRSRGHMQRLDAKCGEDSLGEEDSFVSHRQ